MPTLQHVAGVQLPDTAAGFRRGGMELPSFDALREYQQHPVHREFLAWLMARDCTPLAFDYYLDSDTVLMGE